MEKKITWSMLTGTRKRYDKETGASWYERLFVGISAYGKTAANNEYIHIIPDLADSDLVYVFMLGSTQEQKNIVFIHKKGDSVVYANANCGNQARAYAEFYASEAGAEIRWIEGLPTVKHTRIGGGAVDSLEKALEKAENTEIDF